MRPWEELPRPSDRQPEAVIIRQARGTDLIVDRRNFITDTAAQRQPFIPFIFCAGREEPAIFILERQRHRRAYNRRRSAAWLQYRRGTDATPVRPFHGTEKRPLSVKSLPDAERNSVGKVERGVDGTGRCKRAQRERRYQGAVDFLVDA